MATRAEMVEKGAVALLESDGYLRKEGVGMNDARTVLDAILPVVSTVAELETLPDGAVVVGHDGAAWQKTLNGQWGAWGYSGLPDGDWLLRNCGPSLTVVWRP